MKRRTAAPPTRFVVIGGPPCSGKSLRASRLSQLLSAPRLEMDAFRLRALPQSDQRVEDRDIAYRAMHHSAEAIARYCHTIILDATYTARSCRTDLVEAAGRVDAALYVVECQVTPTVAIERFRQRPNHAAVDLTPVRVAALASAYPHSEHAFVIRENDDETSRFAALVRYLHGPAMERAALDAWCLNGRPREEATRRVPRWDQQSAG